MATSLQHPSRLLTRLLVLLCAVSGCAAPRAATPTAAALRVPVMPVAAIPQGPPRTLRGLLIDSLLTNDALRGALLTLDDASHVTASGDNGQFVFDSIRPGLHRLIVRHPLLDSLGLDTVGIAVRFDGSAEPVRLMLPDPQVFLASRCGVRRNALAEGMILGIVRRADSDAPMAGVEVAAAWRGADTSYAGGGMRERTRIRTGEHGQFLICRAPRFSTVEIWARQGAVETSRVRVQLGEATFGAWDLSLEPVTPIDSAGVLARDSVRGSRARLGTVTGRILMQTGDALPRVTVQLDRPARTTTTDIDGRFTFAEVPPGVRAVDVRAIGFRPSRLGLNVRPGQVLERDITMDRTAAVLGAVTVRATRRATWDSVGFEARRNRGGGYFFTSEQLKGISDLGTAMRLVPGVSGRSDGRSQRLTAGRGAGCLPAFVVNGVRFQAGGAIGPEAMFRASDIRAMEVYTSQLSTPPEYQRWVDCSVVVIWLRNPQAEIEARQRKP